MKILLSGASGFVGTSVVANLIAQKDLELCALLRHTQEFESLINTIDCTKEDWTGKIVDWNPDVIIHLAAAFTNKSDHTQIRNLVDSNILLTAQLAEAANRCSNCKAFVNTGTFIEFFEGDGEAKPSNLYAATKAAARPILAYYQQKGGWKWINVIVYSPYGRKNKTKKVIDYLIDALDAKQSIDFSPGEQVLDFIHVDDMARFYEALIDKIDELPEGYTQLHLGTGEGHTLREVGSILEKLSGKKLNANWGGRQYSAEDPMHAVAPVAKTFRLLGWKPQETLESGVRILLSENNLR